MEDQVFGKRYRVTERIGSGGMAEVYKAVDEVLGRTVAVKVLHPRYAGDSNFVARFRQEAQAAANLSNPHIVNIYDWGQDDSTYYIVMEYVRGTDLKSLVDEKGALDPMKAADYAAQVCSALAVAHGYDIVHRDIKPHNIVLTPDGQIKVMDFGIARAGNTTMTQTGSVLGTAQYISPEQAQGRQLGPASDLYSLGVVLYELTTGRLPFEADTPVAVALKQVNEQAVPPRQIRPDIPPPIEAVIMRAMAKDPAERYASAEDMRADLRRVIAGQPVAPGEGAAAAAAASQTTVMPAVTGAAAAQAARRSAPLPKKRSAWPWVVAVILLLLAAIGLAYGMGWGPFGPGSVTVPDVKGLTLADARVQLASKELTAGTVTQRNDEIVKQGEVLEETPTAGTNVPKGSAIDLVVSSGPVMVKVPDVVGKKQNVASLTIQSAGLVASTDTTFSSKPSGTVVSQSPAAGTNVRRLTTVTIVVSQGTEKVNVPDVRKKTKANAVATLRNAGFTVSVNESFSNDTSKDTVIDQTPGPGASIDKGSNVTIIVSKGPQTFAMPKVVGMNWKDARAKLEGSPYNFVVTLVPPGTPPDTATVSAQNPPQGVQLKNGDPVTITAP